MKIILVNPFSNDRRSNSLPLGLLYLAGSLRNAHYDVLIYDFHNRLQTEKSLYKLLCDEEIALVGFTVCTEIYFEVIQMSNQIKNLSPNTVIVLGGPHASECWDTILRDNYQFDLISIGPGEQAIVNIANNLAAAPPNNNWSSINNIAYRTIDGMVHKSNWVNMDINLLPLPDYNDYKGKYDGIPSICTARGCAFQCSFCALNNDPKIRWKCITADRVHMELEELGRFFSLSRLDITDADFFTSPAHAEQVINILIECSEIQELHISCRVDSILRCWNLFCNLIEHFTVNLELGIEAYSQSQLDRYDKKINKRVIDEVINRLSLLKGTQLKMQLDFILFDPYVTLNELQETNQFIIKNHFNNKRYEDILFTKMLLFPNTIMKDKAILDGLCADNGVYVPYWKFQNNDIAIIYAYMHRYELHLLPLIKTARQKLIDNSDSIQTKNKITYLKKLKELSSVSFRYFNSLLQEGCNLAKFEMIYQKQKQEVTQYVTY